MITIIKQDSRGKEVWRYPGEVLERSSEKILVAARFTRDDFEFNGMLLKEDDLFLEAYYRKKWYNIFEIYDRDDGRLKGWYCNIVRPAKFTRWYIACQDLALDLLVHFQGQPKLLDEDEFHNLDLSDFDQKMAWQAVDDLNQLLADQRFRLKLEYK